MRVGAGVHACWQQADVRGGLSEAGCEASRVMGGMWVARWPTCRWSDAWKALASMTWLSPQQGVTPGTHRPSPPSLPAPSLLPASGSCACVCVVRVWVRASMCPSPARAP